MPFKRNMQRNIREHFTGFCHRQATCFTKLASMKNEKKSPAYQKSTYFFIRVNVKNQTSHN